jgi:hypothetical protein
MATVDERTNDKGFWVTAAGDGASVSLYQADQDNGPYSLYWHGLTNLRQIEMFLEPQFERGQADTAGILAFTTNDRFQTVARFKQLDRILPPDTRFLRVECLSCRREGPPLPVLIVWARLDLAQMNVAPGRAAPDEIGVHLRPDHYESISEPLVPFISETHFPRVERGAVTDCLEALSGHLRPANDYTYA